MSSAYNETSQCLVTAGRSLMYARNNNGPRMLPLGTPTSTGRASDSSFPQEVRYLRFLKYDLNHAKEFSDTPTVDNLVTRILWSTVSNDFVRSKYTAPQIFPLSMLSKTSSAKPDNAVAVDRLERKPNWLFDSKMFEIRYSYSCEWTTLSMILLRVGSIEMGR